MAKLRPSSLVEAFVTRSLRICLDFWLSFAIIVVESVFLVLGIISPRFGRMCSGEWFFNENIRRWFVWGFKIRGGTLNTLRHAVHLLWLSQFTSDNFDNLLGYVEIRLFVRYYILVSRCISNKYSRSFDSNLSVPFVWLIVIRQG